MSDIESLKERLELSDCETDEQLAQYWHQEAIEARSKLAEAERALEQGAVWFEEYAEHHAKLAEAAGHHVGQERDAKAKRNQERADYLRASIREEEPLPKQGEE